MRPAHTLALLAGCNRLPLDRVPIHGGTAEQQEAARDELAAFDQAVGPGRLTLASVRFAALGGEVGTSGFEVGGSFRSDGRIRLDEQLRVGAIAATLQHELCHALDDAEHLSDHQAVRLDRLGDSAMLIPLERTRSAAHRRREAFAQLCDDGPDAARLLAPSCTTDDRWPVYAWLADAVWVQGALGDPVHGAPLRATPSWSAPAPLLTLGARYDAPVHAVALELDTSEEPLAVEVDLTTGELVPGLRFVPVTDEPPAVPDLPGVLWSTSAGWEEGPAAAVARVANPLGDAARPVVWDGASWSTLAGGCLPDGPLDVFGAGGQVWAAWTEGPDVRWRPLYPDYDR